ncbi:hypothetical protein, partial [Pedobacter ginsengiterrae]|uniref:hypothetical protein n=1 Tax=Pedobacter ginsengiterrae TaxID=871696 RepID=UPI0031D8491E
KVGKNNTISNCFTLLPNGFSQVHGLQGEKMKTFLNLGCLAGLDGVLGGKTRKVCLGYSITTHR